MLFPIMVARQCDDGMVQSLSCEHNRLPVRHCPFATQVAAVVPGVMGTVMSAGQAAASTRVKLSRQHSGAAASVQSAGLVQPNREPKHIPTLLTHPAMTAPTQHSSVAMHEAPKHPA